MPSHHIGLPEQTTVLMNPTPAQRQRAKIGFRIRLGLIALIAFSMGFTGCHRPEKISAKTAENIAATSSHAQTTATAPTQPLGNEIAYEKPTQGPAKTDPWLIAPGVQVGKITAQTTLSDLQGLYGKENVKAGQVSGPEGSTLPGALLFPKEPKKELILYWKTTSKPSSKANPTVESVVINQKKSVWHTSEGIKIGTTLRELEQMNGQSFTMSGLDWDYGGMVLSWGDRGKLREKFQKNGGMAIQLDAPEDAHGGYESVEGEKSFSSGNAALQRLNPVVASITVFLQ